MFQAIHKDQPHFNVATALNGVGRAYQVLNDLSAALEYKKKALETLRILKEKRYNTYIASTLDDMGDIAYSLGEYVQSAQYKKQAAEMCGANTSEE
jgi:tetratricopeptide (TPR) repeat protein